MLFSLSKFPRIGCFITIYPKKAHFFHFLVVFWAPKGQPEAPFIFKACILAYNYNFFIKVTENLIFFDCIPKKQLILVVFQLFLVVFWAPIGQPGAPLLFKACILACNNICFIKVPRIGGYFTVYPKKAHFCGFFAIFGSSLGPYRPAWGPIYIQSLYSSIQ